VATNINAPVGDATRRRSETEELPVTRCLTRAIERAAHGTRDRTSLPDLRQFAARGG
jgi:hypothetical protein